MEYTTLEQVKIRLGQYHIETVTNDDDTTSDVVVFDNKEDNPIIEQLIKQATEDVKARRNYPDSYTDEMITEDLKKFESVIVNLAVYDHSQAGEAFMASYNEMVSTELGEIETAYLLGYFHLPKYYNAYRALQNIKEDCALPFTDVGNMVAGGTH